MSKGKRKQIFLKMRNNLVVLAMFILVVVLCANILRSSLIENTNKMGRTLVENYSTAEETNMRACEAILTISVNYIEEREKNQVSLQELKEGLYPFMNGLIGLYGEENLQIYGKAMGGTEPISNNPEIEAMIDYNVEDKDYYKGAMAAQGDIYISPAYVDTVTGMPVVTMSKAVPSTGSFLAIDMMYSCFQLNNKNLVLPQKASYYLIDREGTLL